MAESEAMTHNDVSSHKDDLVSSFNSWLEKQCHQFDEIFLGLVAAKSLDSNEFRVLSAWPDRDSSLDTAMDIIQEVIREKKGLITALELQNEENLSAYVIAYPVKLDDEIVIVAAQALSTTSQDVLKQTMQRMELASGWLASYYQDNVNRNLVRSNQSVASNIELLAKISSEKSFNRAAVRFVTELSIFFKCDRVSLGFIKNKSVKINQLSHSAQFGKKMNLVKLIESAMDEAIDQKAIIALPEVSDSNLITLSHKKLQETQKLKSVMTVPLYKDYDVVGAITLEREESPDFLYEDGELCEAVCSLSINTLLLKKENDRNIFLKIIDSVKQQFVYLLGEKHYLYKTIFWGIFIFIGFLYFYESDYKLTADAVVKSDVRQAIVAPFDGYIEESSYRAGDNIVLGNTIVSIDTKNLHLEKLRWLSQQKKLSRQYQEALSQHDRAKLNILQAQQDQADAQLKLVEMKLDRAMIRSPIDGHIISGDLSNRLGDSVSRGEELFVVSPHNSYRVVLKVRQNRISDIAPGMEGKLYLTALPGNQYAITINKVTPITVAEEGVTYYEVEAELLDHDEQLQLGMEGLAKISIDERKLLHVLTRDFTEWVDLKWWSFFG